MVAAVAIKQLAGVGGKFRGSEWQGRGLVVICELSSDDLRVEQKVSWCCHEGFYSQRRSVMGKERCGSRKFGYGRVGTSFEPKRSERARRQAGPGGAQRLRDSAPGRGCSV